MRGEELREVIISDIRPPRETPPDLPLEVDPDLTRQDAWMFTPLFAVVVALPLAMTALLGVSAWQVLNGVHADTSTPTTFASRWPDKPMTVLR